MRVLKKLFPYDGLPKEIYVLFIARIVNSTGNFVFPFLTLLLTEKMGYGEKTAGFFLMLASITFIPSSLLSGWLTDCVGRKKVILACQGMAAIFLIPCAFLGNSILIPYLLILSTFFSGAVRPANSAMVTDLTTPENRNQAFSLLYLGINLGFAFGPLIAGYLFYNHTPFLFLGDAATTFIAVFLVAFYVKETKPTKEEIIKGHKIKSGERPESGNIIRVLLKRRILLCFVFIFMIFSLVATQVNFAIPLQFNELFGKKGVEYYAYIITINAITVLLLTTFFTTITKKIEPILNVALSSLLYFIGFGMIFFISNIYLFVVSTLIWTSGEILSFTNSNVFIANHTPMTHRARFNAILPTFIGIGNTISPYIFGTIIENYGIKIVWPVTAVIFGLCIIALCILHMIEKTFMMPVQTSQPPENQNLFCP